MTTTDARLAREEHIACLDCLQARLDAAHELPTASSRLSEASAVVLICIIRLNGKRNGFAPLPADLTIDFDRLCGQAQKVRRICQEQLVRESRSAFD